jgi:CDP-glucose 4,6-dehydratase
VRVESTVAPDFWVRRNVLVTGCTGILGSWLTIRLIELGARVVGLIRDEVPHSNLWSNPAGRRVMGVRGDLVDFECLLRVLNEYEVDTVFHLAAQTIVPIANNSPLSTFESNVRGTWNLLEAVRLTPGVRATVVASSDKAYGPSDELPYLETHRLEGGTPYDVSKSCADLICRSYHEHWGLPVCVSRCGNIFGGGDLNWNRLVPGTIRSCHYGAPIEIRSDGTLLRDYIYVKDVVESYLAIAFAMDRPEVRGEAFNVSNEQPRSVLEVAEGICARMGRSFEPVVLDRARGEIRAQYLDSTKVRKLTGWQGAWSIEDALDETIAWYRRFFDEGEGGPPGLRRGGRVDR